MNYRFLLISLLVALAGDVNSQYTKLLDFAGASYGGYPHGDLIYDGNFMYGMTSGLGKHNLGTVFKVKPDGSGFVKLLNFAGTLNGSHPYGSLIMDSAFLYGMTKEGGTNNKGTAFKIKKDGSGFVKLRDFSGTSDGSNPNGSLINDGTFLYGMTSTGGTNNYGTIFKIKPDGTGFMKLLDFAGVSNGRTPNGSLLSDGTYLFGMTKEGGSGNKGVIFKIMPDGTGYSKLLDFAGSTNGQYPEGSLISDGAFFYGMTRQGGASSAGTIFKILPDGTGYTKLSDFGSAINGRSPYGSLIYDGSFLYGMTQSGGAQYSGTIFKIMPDGTGFTKLLDFVDTIQGRSPYGSLIYDGIFLYGMTSDGGHNRRYDFGTMIKIKPDGSNYERLLDFGDALRGQLGWAGVISDSNYLYGITACGGGGTGSGYAGTVFKIKTDGTGYERLFDFGELAGEILQDKLVYDGAFLYGTAQLGQLGSVFKVRPDGTGFSKLLDFTGTNGEHPYGTLQFDGTFLYGMGGGSISFPFGYLYKIKTDGTGYAIMHNFSYITSGLNAVSIFLLDSNYLYGFTRGGVYNHGTMFKIKTDGTGFTKLIDFPGTIDTNLWGDIIYDGTFFYKIAGGGTSNMGTLFKIKPDGTGFVKLWDFAGNTTGRIPVGSLIYDGTFLYGHTWGGGTNDLGMIYRIKPDGTDFEHLFDFAEESGRNPNSNLFFDGTYIYGATYKGGDEGEGVLYKYKPCIPPPVVANASATTVCIGDSIILTGNGANVYTWSDWVNDGVSFVPPIGTTTYTLCGVDTSTGCQNYVNKVITVSPLPNVNLTLNADTVCSGASPITLSDGSPSGGIYSGNRVSGGVYNPVIAGFSIDTILYTYVDTNGCSNNAKDKITILPLPNVTLVLNADSVCSGVSPITLSGGSPSGGIYSGNGVSGGIYNPVIAGFGIDSILYTYADTNGCSNNAKDKITILPLPNVNLILNADTVCSGASPITLSGGSPSGGIYSGSGVSGGIYSSATISGPDTILYSYTDNNGCSNDAKDQIFIDVCTGYESLVSDRVIVISPNPFATETMLYSGKPFMDATVIVYNALGEVVKKITNIKGHVYILNRYDLSSGFHFLHVVENERVSFIAKMIIADN